jgi:hypothetical protein
MTAFGSAIRLERSSAVTGTIAAISMIAASIIIGVILVELICYFFVPSINGGDVYNWNRRIMFFAGGGTIFQNQGDIFTYVPNNEVRSVTVYFSDDNFVAEYDYRFHANNYGLVQDTDVVPGRPSLLLLGDSFTEGQGAEPWFRQLSVHTGKIEYQVINGGLIGTGFEQWRKLEQYLSAEGIQIRKLIVLFISDDYARGVWNFSAPVLRCLTTLSSCRADESIYYRLPPASELSSWVDKIRTIRTPTTVSYRLQQLARRSLPVSSRFYDYLSARLKKSPAEQVAKQRSRAAILEMVRRYGTENVAFVHLPQKDEIDGSRELGLEARRSIQDAGGNLFDGFKLCHLTAADYRIHDGHPNKQGYSKIADCVGQVTRRMVTAAQ